MFSLHHSSTVAMLRSAQHLPISAASDTVNSASHMQTFWDRWANWKARRRYMKAVWQPAQREIAALAHLTGACMCKQPAAYIGVGSWAFDAPQNVPPKVHVRPFQMQNMS